MFKSIKQVCLLVVAAVSLLSSCSMGPTRADAAGPELTLDGAQEVPANTSAASGKSTIQVGTDKSVTGTVTYKGFTATAAHIHEGAKGVNGPVVLPLMKTSDTSFGVAPNTKLTDAQYATYRAGNLYLNVHSAGFPGGEIRAQLTPR